MKKLMIAAAIICAAAMSQAATVTWGGAVATPDGQGYLTEGTKAALLWSATAFTGAATELDGFDIGASANNGGQIVHTYALTDYDANTASAFGAAYDKANSGVDGYYAVLILNEAGDMASYYEVAPITGTTAASGPTDRKVNYSWGGGEYLTSGGYTVAVGAVPEPTSGLLLLLGVAGLALRRRRA